MKSIIFYYSFGTKLRQSSFGLFISCNCVILFSENSVFRCKSKFDSLIKNSWRLFHRTITVVLKYSGIDTFAAEVQVVRGSSKLLIKPAKIYKFHYGNPKMRLDPQSQKTISLLITITILLNTQMDKFIYESEMETTILACIPLKGLNYQVVSWFLQKFSTLTFKNRSYVADKCGILESIHDL